MRSCSRLAARQDRCRPIRLPCSIPATRRVVSRLAWYCPRMPKENPILGAIRDVGEDIARLHRWMTEIDPDNEHYWGEGSWDFTPDWSGSVARGAIARLFRRI